MIDQRAAYRDQFELSARRWQSEHVRGYVLALSRQLVAAEAKGWQRVVGDIERLFARCEPMHEIAYNDYGCSLLWIAFNWYCFGDIATTRNAIKYAMRQWPEEAELGRMLERVDTVAYTRHAGSSGLQCCCHGQLVSSDEGEPPTVASGRNGGILT